MKRLLTLVMMASLLTATAKARDTYNFNSDWRIDNQKKAFTLPRAWNEDEAFRVATYETRTGVVWYRKTFTLPSSAIGKKVFIEFEGARQVAEVYLNGKKVGLSENGTMAFGFDLTPYFKKGKNLIEVKTDNSWNCKAQATGANFQWQSKAFNVNYDGIIKNVWLHVMPQTYQTLPLFSNLGTTGTYIYGKSYDVPSGSVTVCVESQVKNESNQAQTKNMTVVVEETNGKEIARFNGGSVTIPAGGTTTLRAEKRLSGLHFWSWGYGYLYKVDGGGDPTHSFDTYENTLWTSAAKTDSAWISYTLCEKTRIDEICMKMGNFRNTTYPIAIYAESVKVWEGWTPKSLGYIHIPLNNCPVASQFTIAMQGSSAVKDAFGMVKEMDARNDEKKAHCGKALKIIEVEFLRNVE